MPPVVLPDGTRISSTAIRRALLDGDWALAESMLGRAVPEELRRNAKKAAETLA